MNINPQTIRDPLELAQLRKQGITLEDLAEWARGQQFDFDCSPQLISAIWHQPVLNLDSTGYWRRLHRLELDPARRHPRDCASAVTMDGNTTTVLPQDLYTQEYLHYLREELNIWIGHCQVFHRWGDSHTLDSAQDHPVHVDTPLWGDQAAINYVEGEDTGTMYWYKYDASFELEHERDRGFNLDGVRQDQSAHYRTTRPPSDSLEHIGSTPTLVRIDVPHRVYATQERWCVSWRLLNMSTWQAHIDQLAPLYTS